MAMREPIPGQQLWSGRALGSTWRVSLVEVLVATELGEPDEHGLCTAPGQSWVLAFESESGEHFQTTWSPEHRILFGTLRGWPKGTVESL